MHTVRAQADAVGVAQPQTTSGDLALADLIPLEDVPARLPARRGRRHHRSTPFRWASKGLHGVVLRTVRIGGTLATTETWLLAFFAAAEAARRAAAEPPPKRPRRRPSKGTPRTARTDATLARHGLASGGVS